MASGKREKQRPKAKTGNRNRTLKTQNPIKRKRSSNRPNTKNKNKNKNKNTIHDSENSNKINYEKPTKQDESKCSVLPLAEQLGFFLDRLAIGARLSSLELESVKDTCLLKLSEDLDQSPENLIEHMKAFFGSSWKQMLCENHLVEGNIEPGNPSLVVVSLSAVRSLEVHRALRPLTRECPAAKLFSKHIKIEEQVSFLKNRVNIACGTPSRIKKLIDMEALGLTRLKVIVLDMHTDVKGFSLFSLPQIRDEFWDLYRSYFHNPLVQGNIRVCLYGPIQVSSHLKRKGC